MTAPVIIAIDAMGGDTGPGVIVPACLRALQRHPSLRLLLVGQPAVLEPYLASIPDRARLIAASEVVAMDEAPARALRGKKDSSMRKALELVRDGEAAACVSAGNTGALVAKARYILKTVDGIDRPAIASPIPATHGKTYMLDLGANADCNAEQLFQFAVMGSGLAQSVFEIPEPSIALLNIGEESIKGTATIQEADRLLRQASLNYIGFVEGDDIMSGKVNVVVTDGFTGNVALKTMEGICLQVAGVVREELSRGVVRRVLSGRWLGTRRAVSRRLDPRQYNGASLVGLRGSVIKSHGGADEVAFGYAIDEAILEAGHAVPEHIARRVAQLGMSREAV